MPEEVSRHVAKSAASEPVELSRKDVIETPDGRVIDLSGLSEDQIQELKMQYFSGVIDTHKKTAELHADVDALDSTLRSFTDQTRQASEDGSHATMTHSTLSSIGRTEIVVGNTEKAASGKVSRSAAGQRDILIWIVGIVAVAAVVVAVAVA